VYPSGTFFLSRELDLRIFCSCIYFLTREQDIFLLYFGLYIIRYGNDLSVASDFVGNNLGKFVWSGRKLCTCRDLNMSGTTHVTCRCVL